MTHFALTRKGYAHLVATLGQAPSPLWVNLGVLSDTELSELRARGADVTNFTSLIRRSETSEFEDALDTILQHHPGQPVWVEYGGEA